MADENQKIETVKKIDEKEIARIEALSPKDLKVEYERSQKALANFIDSSKNMDNPEAQIDWQKAAKEAGRDVDSLKQEIGAHSDFVAVAGPSLAAKYEAQVLRERAQSNVQEPLANHTPSGFLPNESNGRKVQNGFDLFASKQSEEFQDEYFNFNGKLNGRQEVFNGVGLNDIKNVVTTAAGISVDRARTMQDVVMVRDKARDIITRLPVYNVGENRDSWVYVRETASTNTVDTTAENAAYDEQDVATSNVTSTVRKIAGHLKMTEEQMADVSAARGFATARLMENLLQKVEDQGINGNGTDPNWEGLLDVTGIQTQAKTGTITKFDVFSKAIEKLMDVNTFPNLIGFNAGEIARWTQVKDEDGNYMWGDVNSGWGAMLFGVPVVWSQHVADNTAICMNTQDFGVVEKGRVEMEWGRSGTDFVNGRQTVRIHYRGNIVALRPNSLVSITALNEADA